MRLSNEQMNVLSDEILSKLIEKRNKKIEEFLTTDIAKKEIRKSQASENYAVLAKIEIINDEIQDLENQKSVLKEKYNGNTSRYYYPPSCEKFLENEKDSIINKYVKPLPTSTEVKSKIILEIMNGSGKDIIESIVNNTY